MKRRRSRSKANRLARSRSWSDSSAAAAQSASDGPCSRVTTTSASSVTPEMPAPSSTNGTATGMATSTSNEALLRTGAPRLLPAPGGFHGHFRSRGVRLVPRDESANPLGDRNPGRVAERASGAGDVRVGEGNVARLIGLEGDVGLLAQGPADEIDEIEQGGGARSAQVVDRALAGPHLEAGGVGAVDDVVDVGVVTRARAVAEEGYRLAGGNGPRELVD